MRYGFDTDSEPAGVAALVVYAVYRSRDVGKLKVTPDFWGVIERTVKSVAKRAPNLPTFIEKLKPKMGCSTINPRWARTDAGGLLTMAVDRRTGEIWEMDQRDRRGFLTEVIRSADDRDVLDALYRHAAYIVLLVRDRLERERPYEAEFIAVEEDGNVQSA